MSDSSPVGAFGSSARGTALSAWRVTVRGWWVVALVGLAGALCGLGVSLIQTPMYTSSATLYVTSGSDVNAQSAYQGSLASQQRVASYAELVSSASIIRAALEDSGLSIDVDEARTALKASTTPDTVLLVISAESADPVAAANLVNAVASAMTEYVSELETPKGGSGPLAKLTVVSSAEAADEPSSPLTFRNTFVGLIGGGCLGIAILALMSRFDDRIRGDQDVDQVTDAPVLSHIPSDEGLRESHIVDFRLGSSTAAEAFRKLRTNLGFVSVDTQVRKILIVSANADEGKTTIAINLAAALAENGVGVALVGADLRKPALGRLNTVTGDVGLTTYLRSEVAIADLVQPTGVPNLEVLPSGPIPPNPTELLGTSRAGKALSALAESHEYVIVDAPPLLPVADSLVLSKWTDGVLVVVRAGATRLGDLSRAIAQLETSGARILGVVVNDLARADAPYHYSYYGSAEDLAATSVPISSGNPTGQ